MARKKRSELEAEGPSIEVTDDASTDMVEPPPVEAEAELIDPAPRKRRKQRPPPMVDRPTPPLVQRWRITRGGKVLDGKTVVFIKPGKEVTAQTYNLDSLLQQGIEMEKI